MNNVPALEIANLSYSVRSAWTFRGTPVLHDISIAVQPGETFGFLGHNGAGKTTTIKCILGLLRPAAGAIKIFGVDGHKTAARKTVGYLAEQPYFYDYLTVQETLHLFAGLAGIARGERVAVVKHALDLVKISARSKSPMRSLSKGLTQRVGMAQAIVARPKLLILDEPFSGLDPIGRKEFRDLLVELKSKGTTIFMSSHILSDVEFLCDRVSILAHGELKGIFAMEEIPRFAGGSYELVVAGSPEAQAAFAECGATSATKGHLLELSFKTRADAEHALALAIERHIHVESFAFEQGNLEDLFVKLVRFDESGGRAPYG